MRDTPDAQAADREACAPLAMTTDYGLRVLVAVVGARNDARGISPIEAALCRQHLADVVESVMAWCDRAGQVPVSASGAWPGLVPALVAWRLQVAHHTDRATYRAALTALAAQLRGGLLDAIAVEGWALLEEIADALTERLTQ